MLKRCSMLAPATTSKQLVRSIPRKWFHVRYASSGKKRTHYEVLELPRTASAKEVKAAFYRLSMKHHPDKNLNKESAAEEFREVSAAYQVLSNVDSKRDYDDGLEGGSRAHTGGVSGDVRSQTRAASAASVRARPPPPTGSSKYYNFDEFYRQHYGTRMQHKVHMDRDAEKLRDLSERYRSGADTNDFPNRVYRCQPLMRDGHRIAKMIIETPCGGPYHRHVLYEENACFMGALQGSFSRGKTLESHRQHRLLRKSRAEFLLPLTGDLYSGAKQSFYTKCDGTDDHGAVELMTIEKTTSFKKIRVQFTWKVRLFGLIVSDPKS